MKEKILEQIKKIKSLIIDKINDKSLREDMIFKFKAIRHSLNYSNCSYIDH